MHRFFVLVATDWAEEICIGVGADARAATACDLPPVEPDDSWAISRGEERGIVLVLVLVLVLVPPEVARVVAMRDDGHRDEAVPGVLPGSYTGRYRDTTRLARFDLPAGRRAVQLELRDAADQLVGTPRGGDSPPPSRVTRMRGAGPAGGPTRTALSARR